MMPFQLSRVRLPIPLVWLLFLSCQCCCCPCCLPVLQVRTAKAVEAEEEEDALLAALGTSKRRNHGKGPAAAKGHALQAQQIQSYQLQQQLAAQRQQQLARQQEHLGVLQQQRTNRPTSVLQQLQQAAEDMLNGSSYLGGSGNSLLGNYGSIFADMGIDEFLHGAAEGAAAGGAAAAAASAAAAAAAAGSEQGDEGGGSAAGSMQLQAGAGGVTDADRELLEDTQDNMLYRAALSHLANSDAAAAGDVSGTAAAATAAAAAGRSIMRSISPAQALAAAAAAAAAAKSGSAAASAAAAAAGLMGGHWAGAAGTGTGSSAAGAGYGGFYADDDCVNTGGLGSSGMLGGRGSAAAAAGDDASYLPSPAPAAKKARGKGGAAAAAGEGSAKKAAKPKGPRKAGGRAAGRARCSDPETSAALAALTALANAAEGVSRFVGDHARDQDAQAAAVDNAAAQGAGRSSAWIHTGSGGAAKLVEAGSLGPEEEGSRAARGPRAASRFIGVTWRERIQRWEVGGCCFICSAIV